MKFKIKNARLAFANLYQMQPGNDGGKPSFNCTFLTEPTDKIHWFNPADNTWKPMSCLEAINHVAKDKWPEKYAEFLKAIKAKDKIVIRKGDSKLSKDGEPYAGFEGKIAISCRGYTRVVLIDRDGTTPLQEQDGKLYGGCYVNATVDLWAQDDPKWGRGINCKPLVVQFAKDGDAFAGGPPPNPDDLGPVEDLDADETGFEDEDEDTAGGLL